MDLEVPRQDPGGLQRPGDGRGDRPGEGDAEQQRRQRAARQRRSRRPTKPTQAAQIGSRSGLTAIAPTIRIGLSVITPIAASTAATAISAM